MDYESIYGVFIASRRKTEAETAAREYTERHHIIPRCKGGTNANSNIIRLTYREHIFAHALLLKAAQTEEDRWFMAASMSAVLNFHAKGRRDRSLVERRYGWARRLHGASILGSAHPGYKHDEHTLYHTDGRIACGTRQELIEETGLGFRVIYDLIGGRRDHALGWCNSLDEAQARAESVQARETRSERVDGRLYHIDGRTIAGDTTSMNCHGISHMTRRRLASYWHADGWCRDPLEAEMRAEGRWRRAHESRRRKSMNVFRLCVSDPISTPSQQQEETMARPLSEFINYLLWNTEQKKSEDSPHPIYITQDSVRTGDCQYGSAEAWAKSHQLWLQALLSKNLRGGAKKHAKAVMKVIARQPELRNQVLEDLCRRLMDPHGNTSTRVFTLYGVDGRVVEGIPLELSRATGLSADRIRDLTTGRRRYVKGWATSEEEAAKGRLPPGRPRKKAPEPEFFQPGEAEFF